MTRKVVEHVLASSVANAGTFLVGYPDGTDEGFFANARDHYIRSSKYGKLKHGVTGQVSFSFGTTGITITNSTGSTLEAGTLFYVNLDQKSVDEPNPVASNVRVMPGGIYELLLGAPDTADVDGLISAFTGAAADIALNGALTSGGIGTFDVPRNIVVDSGGADTAVLTFTGRDEFGATVVESITLNGTTAVQGKKAFKYIDDVSASAAIANGAFAGPGDILGLPFFLPSTGHVLREMANGAAPTAGTLVAGVTTAATATTGDVRGTYDPNSACDGDIFFSLLVYAADPSDKGVPQYAG
jgi:hypothetical protein